MKRQYRTLILEPQWHPIRRGGRCIEDIGDWCMDNIDEGDVFIVCLFWCFTGPIVAFAPNPMRLAHWTTGRWVLAAFSLLPWIALAAIVVTLALIGVWKVIWWFHNNPPFKIKTRWPD